MASKEAFLFRRPWLAKALADFLLGSGPFDRLSGMFMSAPRRTGKTTFMKEDLLVELGQRGVVTVYVDLWADRSRDPAALIHAALKATLHGQEGRVARAARFVGLTKMGIGSWRFLGMDRIGAPDGPTLTEVLTAIVLRTGRRVALVIDEAQHALTTKAGVDAMFALKAARDALNGSTSTGSNLGPPRLLLVAMGSHREKLAFFLLRDQPFYGADISDFPRLGRDFTDAYTAWFNHRLVEANRVDPEEVWQLFEELGHRPEMLKKVLEGAALSNTGTGSLKALLAAGVFALRQQGWEKFESEWGMLTPLQRAVLARIASEGASYDPFSAASLAVYATVVGSPVTRSDAQSAIHGLCVRNLVWRSARATYALEDQEISEWLLRPLALLH